MVEVTGTHYFQKVKPCGRYIGLKNASAFLSQPQSLEVTAVNSLVCVQFLFNYRFIKLPMRLIGTSISPLKIVLMN